MKKEEIYVVIDSEEKRLRAIQILSDAGEILINNSSLLGRYKTEMELKFASDFWWVTNDYNNNKQEISLDQLEQLLNPQFVVKDVILPFEELQKQAEMHGWELVKKERQIKVGDFGKFWDYLEEGCVYGFIAEKTEKGFKDEFHMTSWSNFAHLTDEEKAQIQENW